MKSQEIRTAAPPAQYRRLYAARIDPMVQLIQMPSAHQMAENVESVRKRTPSLAKAILHGAIGELNTYLCFVAGKCRLPREHEGVARRTEPFLTVGRSFRSDVGVAARSFCTSAVDAIEPISKRRFGISGIQHQQRWPHPRFLIPESVPVVRIAG